MPLSIQLLVDKVYGIPAVLYLSTALGTERPSKIIHPNWKILRVIPSVWCEHKYLNSFLYQKYKVEKNKVG